jgi:hypothetical protein
MREVDKRMSIASSKPGWVHPVAASLYPVAVVIALLSGCVTTQIRRGCSPACENGTTCDLRYGLCRMDPCKGACSPGERCRSGPPPYCQRLNMGEANEEGATPPTQPGGPGPGSR